MSTSTYFDKETEKYLVDGLNLVANAVKSTLGPRGNTVVIQREDKNPVITKDGVSVAKEIKPKDERIKLGADLAISIAQKQMSNCGDGTTTATVLGQEIVNTGMRMIELSENKVNRTSMRRGIEKAKDYVISALDSYAKEIKSDEDLVNIATVSANGDRKLGEIVAEAYRKVGKAGVVLVEETKDRTIRLDFKEGMTLNKGWTSQFFVNNHEDQTAEFDNPHIILSNGKISNLSSLIDVIQTPVSKGEPVVIIAESFDTSVTQGLAMNIIRSGGQIKLACIEAPGYGDRRLDILRDLGIYVGADVGDDPMGIKFEVMSAASFGSCEKIIIKKDETIIRGGKGDPARIAARVEAIEGLIGALKENDTYEREQLGKRLASLTTGVAVIQVGGSSEEEIKELRDRLDDAQYAVKAALEEGYLPGAGNTLLYLSDRILDKVEPADPDEKVGIDIFAKSLKAPFKTLLSNAGVNVNDVVKEVVSKNDIEIGYNAKTMQIVNLLEDGIIDPVKVVKGTVYAASSIASVILTSSVMICTDPVESKGVSLNMMPGMM
ncbi:MAG: chaperonin GroEL [Succinivibrionaceae bacterium]